MCKGLRVYTFECVSVERVIQVEVIWSGKVLSVHVWVHVLVCECVCVCVCVRERGRERERDK